MCASKTDETFQSISALRQVDLIYVLNKKLSQKTGFIRRNIPLLVRVRKDNEMQLWWKCSGVNE